MKKYFSLSIVIIFLASACIAQDLREGNVPAIVKTALAAKFPVHSHIAWEKENGNYEANWGGKSDEDTSVQYSPSGKFIEMVKAILVKDLPAPVLEYVKTKYNGAKITEAGKVTHADGKVFYEAEVHGRDVIFDENGKFQKSE